MSFERKSGSQPEVPNPTRQARVILEGCQNDVNEARIIAATNVKFARTRENIDYWSQVDRALVPKDLDTYRRVRTAMSGSEALVVRVSE